MSINKARLLIIKDGKTFDVTDLLISAKWSGRKGAAPRTLAVELADDRNTGHGRAGIAVTKGHQCIFMYDKKELFRGMFMKQDQSDKKTMTLTAYDNAIRLANNKDTFNYTDATAGVIFQDCLQRFGIPQGGIADTVHRIPELVKPSTTAWDVIQEALSETYKSTGVRYYVRSHKGNLDLFERKQQVAQWALETGENIQSYKRTIDIEKVITRLKLLSSDDTVVAEATAPDMEERIGIFQDIEKADEDLNEAQLTEQVNASLEEKKKPKQTISVTAFGRPDIISGASVFLMIKDLNLSGTFYVEDDTHTFKGETDYTMTVKLVLDLDF